jgi:energy-coupling factor transporter ATP-binding protein EcfA2
MHGSQGKNPAIVDLSIDSGSAVLIVGGLAGDRSRFLRMIAGFEPPSAGKIEFVFENGSKFPAMKSGKVRMGYLPPPGEEVFVGTTVEQEMFYGLPGEKTERQAINMLEELFGVGFSTLACRPVWSLSDGERRLLALASQALYLPDVWFMDQPLALLDGTHRQAVGNFLAGETRRGGTFVGAVSEPGLLIQWADIILNFSKKGEFFYRRERAKLPGTVAEEPEWSYQLVRKLVVSKIQGKDDFISRLLAAFGNS